MNSGDPFKLGSRYNGQSHFSGHLSDVSIWGIALSESQIQSLMSTSSTSNEQGLLGYWKSDAGTGDILYDHSGNANHGTINGATWSTDVPVLGCTDPYAENYNADANVDDGSCSGYPDNGEYLLSFDGADDYVDTGIPYTDLLGANEIEIKANLDGLVKTLMGGLMKMVF